MPLRVLLVFLLATIANGRYCYSCAGTCHSEPCNCQMGSCESEFCFTEKRPTEVPGIFRIVKGCIKNPSRTRVGCDYDRTPHSVQCICRGDFCNDAIYMRSALRRNITCRHCTERDPDCDRTCQGQWCYEDAKKGSTGCGYGPPVLAFFYKGTEVLDHRSKVCITMSSGTAVPQKHCICNTHLCNDLYRQTSLLGFSSQRSRSLVVHYPEVQPKVQTCVSCDVSAEDNSVTSGCRQNKCYGHYCTYTTQRIVIGGFTQRMAPQAIIHVVQGCINVTDHRHVQLGCSHKWMNNEEETLYCACDQDNCNVDLQTAALSFALQFSSSPFILIILYLFQQL